MEVFIKKYRIVSSEQEYKVLKPKGSQWTPIGHYPTLEMAISDLSDYRVRTELKDFVVDFNDATNLEAQKTALISKINAIKSEILEGLK
ncbi:hypothetical protein IJI91_00710 [Candidatus Saccharibacteria bacterium]|nr:hypothetical protein [Candidatus Saccharibacteria bacterium]